MEFYHKNKVIFLTGATGFVGKTLLEKILRSLPSVEKVYVLVRASADKTIKSRLENEIIGSRVFETLRSQYSSEQEFQEQIASKVYPIQGDINLEKLGMSDEDIMTVQADTNVVLHCAASINFKAPLKKSINTNVNGTIRLTQLCEEMPNLAAFVHVSSAFVNIFMNGQIFKEEIYPYPLGNPREILDMLNTMSDDEIKKYEKEVVLDVYPYTYSAAKGLTEHIIQEWRNSKSYPVVIVRPSMICGSISEPVPGWVEGMSSANGLIVLCGTGELQEIPGDVNNIVDLIPVDVVCKTILMAATQARSDVARIPIFHSCSSTIDPISGNDFVWRIEQYWRQAKITNIKRVSNDIRVDVFYECDFDRRYMQRFSKELELARDTSQVELCRKLFIAYKVPQLFKTFWTNEFIMDSTNTIELDEIAPKPLHSGMTRGFNWPTYIHIYITGCHEYLMKDKVDKNQVIKYKWEYQQRYYDETEGKVKRFTANI